MEITINIPDGSKDICVEALTKIGHPELGGPYKDLVDYYDEVTGETTQIPNPESQAAFAKKVLIQHLKQFVVNYQLNKDAAVFNAAQAVKAQAVKAIDIT
jgi:hypothetical protein